MVIGSNISLDMVEKASQHSFPKLNYLVSNAEKIPFWDQTFGLVTAFSSFHWFYITETINEIKRVLKKGGRLIVSIPYYKSEKWLLKLFLFSFRQ